METNLYPACSFQFDWQSRNLHLKFYLHNKHSMFTQTIYFGLFTSTTKRLSSDGSRTCHLTFWFSFSMWLFNSLSSFIPCKVCLFINFCHCMNRDLHELLTKEKHRINSRSASHSIVRLEYILDFQLATILIVTKINESITCRIWKRKLNICHTR